VEITGLVSNSRGLLLHWPKNANNNQGIRYTRHNNMLVSKLLLVLIL
jgi:hypothetical protein